MGWRKREHTISPRRERERERTVLPSRKRESGVVVVSFETVGEGE